MIRTPPVPAFPISCERGAASPWPAAFRALRDEALSEGWTSAGIARELYGVSRQHFREWYEGLRDPPLWAVRRLAYLVGRGVVLLPDRVLLPGIERVEEIC